MLYTTVNILRRFICQIENISNQVCVYSARTYPACREGEKKKKRKDRECFSDVRSGVLAKGEREGSEEKGKNSPSFLLSLYLSWRWASRIYILATKDRQNSLSQLQLVGKRFLVR